MHGKTDIARSIKRYLSLMWDEDSGWTIRTERRVVKDDQRPVAVVLLGQKQILRARSSRNQGMVVEGMPLTLYAYPPVGEDERLANAAAEELADLLMDVFTTGLSPDPKDVDQDPPWYSRSGPFRLPLWDYAGVPLTGKGRAGPEEPHDVIWVDPDSVTVQNLEDPQDAKRRTVVLEARLSIDRPGRREPQGPVTKEMPGGFKVVGTGEL